MKIQWMQFYHTISTILLLLWKLTAAIQQDYEEVLYASACFHQVKKSLTLSCGRGHMVKLNRIFYAYTGDENTCSYLPGHCTMDLPESESYSCIGRSSCTINLPSGDTGKYIPKCQHYGTYAQAEYHCIPDTETTDICEKESNVLTSQRGFISTPNYPYNYPNHQNCILKIQAPYTDQKITLYTIDLTLEENRTDCADWLHLFDGHRAATYCAARVRVTELTTLESWLELNFYSGETNNRKGFWLYYEAIPYREVTISVNQGPTIPTQWSHLTTASDVNNKKSEENQTSSTLSNRIPVDATEDTTTAYTGTVLTAGAIVGVVVSLLLLITVIILVILVCKKKETSNNNVKVPSSVSCNSEAAFLNFGPNCYAQTPQLATSPSYLDYNQHHGSVNQDFEATETKTTGSGMNITGVNEYKLDADYYKKNGRYLEEVI